MNTQLSQDHVKFLELALATGKHQDESDALNQAIDLLQRRDHLEEELDAARKQLENGQGIPAEEAFSRLQQEAAEIQDRAADQRSEIVEKADPGSR